MACYIFNVSGTIMRLHITQNIRKNNDFLIKESKIQIKVYLIDI